MAAATQHTESNLGLSVLPKDSMADQEAAGFESPTLKPVDNPHYHMSQS